MRPEFELQLCLKVFSDGSLPVSYCRQSNHVSTSWSVVAAFVIFFFLSESK